MRKGQRNRMRSMAVDRGRERSGKGGRHCSCLGVVWRSVWTARGSRKVMVDQAEREDEMLLCEEVVCSQVSGRALVEREAGEKGLLG